MGIRSFVKNTVKDNTNLKGWTGWDAIKQNAQLVGSFVKEIKPQDKEDVIVPETFEQAVQRFGLTEAELRSKMRMHWIVSLVCFFLGLGALCWGFHLLWDGMYLSCLVGFALGALMFAYAFYESFSHFRIKKRRLDCTFSEWAAHFFRRS